MRSSERSSSTIGAGRDALGRATRAVAGDVAAREGGTGAGSGTITGGDAADPARLDHEVPDQRHQRQHQQQALRAAATRAVG